MNKKLVAVVSWLITLWVCKVFLLSLPYKFSLHPDTQHIFATIGAWMSGYVGITLGDLFAKFGSYAVGSFELLTSLVLLSPALIWALKKIGGDELQNSFRAKMHKLGGLMSTTVMAGATFFHLATPLGIEVLHEGKSDGGSLFYAAVSILILGIIMYFINASVEQNTER